MKTFGKQSLGVHGQELPKYEVHAQEYWKLNKGFNDIPSNTSQRLLLQNRKYWA